MKMKLHWPTGMANIGNQRGFTLVELMITVVVTMVLVASVFATHQVQSTTYSVQREVSKMQQGLRGSLHVLEWDIHNALRDPSPRQRSRFAAGNRWYDLAGNVNNAGQPGLEFVSTRLDNDADGIDDSDQTVRYWVLDPDGDGIPGLYRRATPDPADIGPADPNGRLVADGIQAIGFAYAYDADGDNVLERYNGNAANPIVWAVDSDNGGNLDAILDVNNDGAIDMLDDTDGNGRIERFDDALNHLGTPATFDQVRAVRIFLLVVSERPFGDHMIDRNRYVVGNQVIDQPDDRFKRRLMTLDVALRNYIR